MSTGAIQSIFRAVQSYTRSGLARTQWPFPCPLLPCTCLRLMLRAVRGSGVESTVLENHWKTTQRFSQARGVLSCPAKAALHPFSTTGTAQRAISETKNWPCSRGSKENMFLRKLCYFQCSMVLSVGGLNLQCFDKSVLQFLSGEGFSCSGHMMRWSHNPQPQ